MALLASILIDGVAYGMILFMIAVGLTVTLGLMRVVNLAHGLFAMLGGYLAALLMARFGTGYIVAVIAAPLIVAVFGLALERGLVRMIYGRTELDQVLLTIGIAFMGIAGAGVLFGNSIVAVPLPAFLSGATDIGFRMMPTQRLAAIVVGAVAVVAIWVLMERTRFGIHLRATVDHTQAAQASGINTSRVYALTFALGAMLAAIGGIIGAQLLPIEPNYVLKYLVLFLAVVAVGGLGSVWGSLTAAVLLGTIETAGKYLMPDLATVGLYLAMLAILSWRPGGLFGRQ
ncbi:MAG: branched-chain amino acid ABC transporter permease [Rhizobiaceae bacterium]|nr:branched-chain amino acid ABC transporter permease [Rhizobiaceae bacterium]